MVFFFLQVSNKNLSTKLKVFIILDILIVIMGKPGRPIPVNL